MKKTTAAILACTLAISACSTSSKKISATYITPTQYHNYDCDQLASETQRLHPRITQLGARLDEAASNDAALMGVGMILFWPALFALGGTKEQEAEYGRLKGEYEAIQQAAIAKKCTLPTLPPVEAANTAVAAPAPVAPAAKPAAKPVKIAAPKSVEDFIVNGDDVEIAPGLRWNKKLHWRIRVKTALTYKNKPEILKVILAHEVPAVAKIINEALAV